jgi:hypothetical protein
MWAYKIIFKDNSIEQRVKALKILFPEEITYLQETHKYAQPTRKQQSEIYKKQQYAVLYSFLEKCHVFVQIFCLGL